MSNITTIRIIDNKKLSLTEQEWGLYQSMCRAYDRTNFKGEELFKDLFESDENGVITFIKPPSTRYTSIEVFLFVVSIMVHQHLRHMYNELHAVMDEVKKELKK